MKHGSLVAAVAALALGALAATAEGQDAAPPPAPPQYEVEILVFAHRSFDPREERFESRRRDWLGGAVEAPREAPVFDESTLGLPTDEPDPLAPLDAPAPAPLADSPELTAPLAEDPFEMRPLRPDELKLNTEYRRLGAVAAYAPLLHAGWVQPGLPEGEAQPFDLALLGVFNPRGTVRVHLSRFLHVTLDLTYQGQAVVAASDTAAGALDELAIAPTFRLAATRNVRSGELHYFDHPAFGVLVRVTPRAAQGGDSARRPAA